MKHSFKKLISLVLVLAISLAISVPAFAATSKTDFKDSGASTLAKKLQMPADKLNRLAPEMIQRLHKDFDSADVIGVQKTYYALDKTDKVEKAKVVTVTKSEFDALASPKTQLSSSTKRNYAGVGTLTSYILSDNSLAMSMDLLDSFHTGSSGSYDVALTLNNHYGTMTTGSTLYSRNQLGESMIDEGTIYDGSDYKTTSYTVPEMVTETDRYFYLSCDCEDVAARQVLKTDFAVCTYSLGLGDGLPSSYVDFLKHFFISSQTKHYTGSAN